MTSVVLPSTPTARATRGRWPSAAEHDIAREQIEWVAADYFALSRRRHEPARGAAPSWHRRWSALNDSTDAQGVLERLEPDADRNVINGRGAAGYGSAAHYVAALAALLGGDDEQRFERALTSQREPRSRPWAARTRELYGRALITKGEHDRGDALLARAREELERLGLKPP